MRNLIFTLFFTFFLSFQIYSVENSNWVVQNSGTTNSLWSVYSIDCRNIWAAGSNGTIIHTTNGGNNWFSQYSSQGMYLQSIFFTSPNKGIAVGKSGVMLRTSNGGNSWFVQNCPTNLELRYIHFINSNTGTVVGGDSYTPVILRTTDGGDSWISQTGGYPIGLKGVFFVDANTGYCSAWLGEIFKTTDAGTTWQHTHTSQSLEGLWFTDENTGTIVGYNGTIIRTTDGGNSWVHQNPGGTTWYFGCYFKNQNTGYVTGYNGTLLRTTNGGQNWISQLSGITNNLYSISFARECGESKMIGMKQCATIVGSNGIILHNSLKSADADARELKPETKNAPSEYFLMQNYPNPFNPTTNIRYQVAKNSFVSLKVFNTLGKEIATLVEQNQLPGIYEVQFSGAQLTSGVYFYKLTTSDGFTDVKRMTILK